MIAPQWDLPSFPVLLAAAAFVVTFAILAVETRARARHRLHERVQNLTRRRPRKTGAAAGGARSSRQVLSDGLHAVANLVLPIIPVRDRMQTRDLLDSAGLRGETAVARFFGVKVTAFATGAALVLLLITFRGLLADSPLFQFLAVVVGAFCAGTLPELVVRALRKRRRNRIRAALADAIDLMIIMANAGQSLDVAMSRVSREMRRMAPALAEELLITTTELQALPNRRMALQNLARRAALPEMRSLTAALIQTIRYGTPLTQALKVLAAELRQAKVLALEEKAAKLPALLSLPLMLLIMPAVFIVTAGPAVLGLADAFFQ